jgi:HTH-type transcriptional regulator / antitoxin HipB
MLKMEVKKMKMFTLEEMKNKHIGERGTEVREQYEYELKMEIIGDMIRKTRLERHLTQEELGKLVGVQKAQISKLENNANSATIDTIVRVFKALKAEIYFNVKLENQLLELA